MPSKKKKKSLGAMSEAEFRTFARSMPLKNVRKKAPVNKWNNKYAYGSTSLKRLRGY